MGKVKLKKENEVSVKMGLISCINQLMSFQKNIDNKLNYHLKLLDIPSRKNASPGIWVSYLLPVVLLVASFRHFLHCSHLYWHFTLLSTSFLISASSGPLHYYFNCTLPIKQISIVVSMSISSLLLTLFSVDGLGLYVNLFHSVIVSCFYHPLLEYTMRYFRYGFTYGEAAVTVQSLLLFLLHSYSNMFNSVLELPSSSEQVALLIIQFGLTCIFVLVSLVFTLKPLRSSLVFYSITLGAFTFGVLLPLTFILSMSPVLWIIQLILSKKETLFLVIYWLVCALIAVAVVNYQIMTSKKASTSLRKYFHILAVAVYIPGLIINRCFLYLAGGVVLAIFIVLEMIRLLKLPPFGDILDTGFQLYVDEKDSTVALTPMYLLIGCSLPLWLHPLPLDQANLLVLMAGILSVGIGDTFASIIGYSYGRHKWKGTSRSIEGSVACFISQILVILLLISLGYIPQDHLLLGIVGSSVVTLIESRTDQVDNLVLPLVQYCIFLLC